MSDALADDLKRAAEILRYNVRNMANDDSDENFENDVLALADRLDAMAVQEPVAWMYTRGETSFVTIPRDVGWDGWIETPLGPMGAALPRPPMEPELEMAIGYLLDNEAPKTLAGCHARIENMQAIIRQLAYRERTVEEWQAFDKTLEAMKKEDTDRA